ncbi:gag-pol polyprotein [Tanacetum coccineum]
MSNTNTNLQTQTSNALHNAIMEASGKDHPPMLTYGNYNPPYKFKWTEKTVLVAEGSSETTIEGYIENYKNVSQDIRDQLNAKAEAVQIILTGIDNDIYSTVDACLNACEMWKEIERFYKMMNEFVRNKCDVTNHQVNVYFLLQLQLEWQRSQPAATRNGGKAVVKSPPPTYDQEPTMVAEDDKMSKEKEIDKLMALISLSFKKIYKLTNNNLRTSSNTSRANQDNTPRINRGTRYDNQRLVSVAGAKENVEQADWRDDTDDEPDDRELEAHYIYMAQIQEVTPDTADNSGPIFDVEPLQKLIEIILFIIDSRCSKHMTGNLKLLCNFMEQFLGTVKFGNDQIAPIPGYGDLIRRINADLEKFHLCLKEEMGVDLRYFNSFEHEEYYYADHMNAILGVYTTLDEFTDLQCDYIDQVVKFERLEKELSKSKTMTKSFEAFQQHAIDLELDLQQYLKAQLQDKGIAVSELKKVIENMKGKSMETKFEKSSVIRQPNAFKSQRQSILVAFGKSTVISTFLRENDLLTGSRGTDLYSITLQDTSTPNLICLMAKASSSQAWLWHLIFDLLVSWGSQMNVFSHKDTPSSKMTVTTTTHGSLSGPMRVESINGKKYVLVIVDEYSKYTWTYFWRSKDETLEVLIDFLKLVQRGLHAQAEAIATACFTQTRSLVIPRHEKNPYHIINGRKSLVKFFHIFGSLCYIVRDGENLDKMKEKDGVRSRSNELDFLFSLMFDELLNGTTQVVSKSSAVTTADAPNQRQQQHTTPSTSTTVAADTPPLNIQTTPETTSQAPTQAPTVTAIENINQAETNKENAQVEEDEFINIFSTPTKDHPLEQVIGNPSQSIRTRRQLETDGEMCMFALTVSQTEPKNIKEAMADSTWIKAMQEELHQFD